MIKKGWVIARDNKTNLNVPREYRNTAGLWTDNRMEAKRYTATERNAEMKWLRGNVSAAWDIFFYKD